MAKTKTKCKTCGKKNKCSQVDYVDKFQEYLLRGTYIICCGLVIYSLMMFNFLAAGDTQKPGNNFVLAAASSLGSVVEDIWYDVAFFTDEVGDDINNTLNRAVKLSYQGVGKIFAITGDVLSKVPEILATPPYAAAKGNYY